MSLVFAAIVPHPPVLIPNIGKENINKLSKTNEALKTLEQDLYASKPDIILVISPHGEIQSKAFTINLSNKYTANFESFGDFATKLNFKGDTTLITTSKESISGKFALNIISEPNLDHGTSIPLFCLTQHIEDARIIPIYFSMLDNLTHVEFGKALKEIILSTDKRIAILASGDLSHCVTKKAPLPYHV
ncbi:MAG: class III extradiol dioxygenase subunit B-like domain-containing protein, partial [bacterium]